MTSNHEQSGARSSSGRVPTAYTIPDPVSVEEHGRTFTSYREGKYLLPNDGEEQDRLDIQHKCWVLLMKGAIHWAPIANPKTVLDIGCGTGIWTIQFARQHPQARVIGTDLSLIQPENTAPPNCHFIREDAEEQWTVREEPFDYIHLRAMCSCFVNARGVMEKVYENLEHGGWVEYQDFGCEIVGVDEAAETFIRNSDAARYWALIKQGLQATGRDVTVPRNYKRWMQELGFVNIVEKPLLAPVNSWPLDPEDKLLGHFSRLDTEKILNGTVKILLAAGMTQEQIPGFLKSVKYDFGDGNLRGYYVCNVVYGQKPHRTLPVTKGASDTGEH